MISNKDSSTFKKYLINKKAIGLAALIIIIAIVIEGYLLNKLFYLTYYKYHFLAAIIVLVIFIILYREVLKADKELGDIERRNYFTWGRGAGAELIVKRSLMTLSDDYRIISDFQTGRGNIDHICIGPTGIFAIEVKAHKGAISYVNGKLKRNNQEISKFLGQAKKGSIFLNQLIKEKINKDYFIVPVLVFPNAKIDNSINHQIENVWVRGRGFEKWVVENCKNALSLEEIEGICGLFGGREII